MGKKPTGAKAPSATPLPHTGGDGLTELTLADTRGNAAVTHFRSLTRVGCRCSVGNGMVLFFFYPKMVLSALGETSSE